MQEMVLLNPSSTLLPNSSRRASLSLHAAQQGRKTVTWQPGLRQSHVSTRHVQHDGMVQCDCR